MKKQISKEIERRFLIKSKPVDLSSYTIRQIQQGYLCRIPAIRVRMDNDTYYMTCKSGGLGMIHQELEIQLSKEAYLHLLPKCDGIIITKKRYEIPYMSFIIELDIFEDTLEGLCIAEVEFESEKDAASFIPPNWFDKEITGIAKYTNSNLSHSGLPKDTQI